MRRAVSSLAEIHKGDEVYCTLTRFREIHEEIPSLGTLNFMGDGEPLMNPELADIIHYAALRDIHTVLTTNATLVTKYDVEHWRDNNVYRIHTSVDAPSKELYEKMRLGAEWEKTLENLHLIGRSGIPFCVNMVLTKQNIHEMPNMVRLCKEVRATEVTFLMPICTYGDDRNVRPDNNRKNQQLFLDTARMCNDLGVKWIFPLTLNPTFRRFNFPFIRPQISIEGDMYACCYSLGRGKVWYEGYGYEVPNYNLGNMFKDGFRKVWHGEDFNKIRQIYKESEERRGLVISKQELLDRTKRVIRNDDERFGHCKICLARWGMACS
jgi:MoaA/NifB/PqqE/SkfB family radical SAM enzyme